MEAFDDVGLEGFSLFFVRVVFLIGDEVSICSVKGEHQAVEFTMNGDGDLEVGVSKELSQFEGFS